MSSPRPINSPTIESMLMEKSICFMKKKVMRKETGRPMVTQKENLNGKKQSMARNTRVNP